MNTTALAVRIWFVSSLVLDAGIFIVSLFFIPREWYVFLPAFLAIVVASTPVLVAMAILLPVIRRFIDSYNNKIYLTIIICGVCAFFYGLAGFLATSPWKYNSDGWLSEGLEVAVAITGILFCTSLITLYLVKKQLETYFEYRKPFLKSNKKTNMETYSLPV